MGHEEGLLAGTKLILERMNIGIGTHNMEAAIKAYLLGSGMVLVPRQATLEMKASGGLAYDNAFNLQIGASAAEECYDLMVFAAPDPFMSNK